MISTVAKVVSLQSRLLLEKMVVQISLDAKNIVLGNENVINMTVVMTLVIPLLIFKYESLYSV